MKAFSFFSLLCLWLCGCSSSDSSRSEEATKIFPHEVSSCTDNSTTLQADILPLELQETQKVPETLDPEMTTQSASLSLPVCAVVYESPLNGYYYAHEPVCDCIEGRNYHCSYDLDLVGEIRHIEGGGVGYKRGYTTASGALFSLCDQSSFIPFLEGRLHLFDHGRFGGNVGGGFRSFSSTLGRILGLNLYYDVQNTFRGNFHQMGAGIEWLGPQWDIRMNGYWPFGKQKHLINCNAAEYEDGFFIIKREYLLVMGGMNVEVGTYLAKGSLVDFYIAFGPYIFLNEDNFSLTGGRGRIAAVFDRAFLLELYYSYDDFFHSRIQVELSIPLASIDSCCSSLFQRVERFEVPVVAELNRWSWNY